MDRITYLSTASSDLSEKDILEIGAISEKNNARDGINGVLLWYKGLFYQILEGNPKPLYDCLARIRNDSRHSDIVILSLEKNVAERKYQHWKMKTLLLDQTVDPLITPVQEMLDLMSRSYRALERYVPNEVLEGIQQGSDPVSWTLKRDQNIVMFVDLVGFSTMIEKINDLNDLELVMNTFFSISAKAVQTTGGKISKLLGDGFMAYYPIDQPSQAIKAALSIIKDLKEIRSKSDSPFLKNLYCGVGISAGPLVKGNIGATLKKDFTLLGDVVNTAARLESYTRRSGVHLLFDQRFRELLKEEGQWKIKKLRKYKPKGKFTKLTIYTLKDPAIPFDRSTKEIAREINEI